MKRSILFVIFFLSIAAFAQFPGPPTGSESAQEALVKIYKVLYDARVGTDGLSIEGGASENFIGTIGGVSAVPSASFTRPTDTTPYASGDLVANSTTAGSVTPVSLTVARVAAGSGMIRRVRISKTGTSITNASFRVHFYRTSPTVTNGDNGVWLSTQAATYIGAVAVTIDRAFSDGAQGIGAPEQGTEINFKLTAGTTIFALVEARAAYTPASAEVFTVSAEILQN